MTVENNELREQIISVLHRTQKPVTVAQLLKKMNDPVAVKAEVLAILVSLEKVGRITKTSHSNPRWKIVDKQGDFASFQSAWTEGLLQSLASGQDGSLEEKEDCK